MTHVLEVLPTFLVACIVLAALPGPATALFVHRTLRDGRAAGLAAVAGNEVGLFAWLLAGGAGLSALLTANQVMFDALHVVGAIVLIALGVQAWRGSRAREPEHERPDDARPTMPLSRGRGVGSAFRASLVSIAANPKAAVFAVSFLPQFLPRSGPVLPDLLLLAVIQVTLDSIWCAGVVLLAERARGWLGRGNVWRRIERALGAILLAIGVELGLEAR